MSSAEKENLTPPDTKKTKLSLSLKKKPKEVPGKSSNERFPVLPPEVIEETRKRSIPKKYRKVYQLGSAFI